MSQAVKCSRSSQGRLGRTAFVMVGFAALFFLSACAAPPAPEENLYSLAPVAVTPMERPLNGVVEVERFMAAGALGNRSLLYRDPASNVLRGYHYHLWLETPPTLLQNALVSYLRSAGAATQVVTPQMRTTPDYTVMGRVLRLESFLGAQPAGAVTIELSLRRESDGTLMVLREYRAKVAASAEDPAAAVAAIDKAVGKVFQRFSADIEAKLQKKAAP